MAGVSCSLNLLYTLRGSGLSHWGWRLILVGLLVTLGLSLLVLPDFAGYIVGSAWFGLVLLPALIQRLANRMLVKRRYVAAMRLARISAWLHPFDAWPDHPDIIRVLQWYHQGRTAEAAALIGQLGQRDTPLGRLCVIIAAQQSGEWENLLSWLEEQDRHLVERDGHLVLARLQALGELGRREEMLHAYQRLLDRSGDTAALAVGMIPLRVAALTGMSQTTDKLTDAMSASLPADAQKFWRLTARQVAGVAGVVDEFRKLQRSASRYLSTMIARRIEAPLPPLREGELDAAAIATRRWLTHAVAHETHYAVLHADSQRPPFATWSIAVVLIGIFLIELPGGSTNPRNLLELGALRIPTSLTPGEWWRMLTAGLLHFGPLHLAMNLMGLLYLGSRLERAWGSFRMIGGYAVATVASMGLAPYLLALSERPPYAILVGASGGVMGLLGAIIGHLTVGWWRGRSRRIKSQLGMLLLIVCLQTMFDLSTPNVSFACHLLGLATGLVTALVLGALDRNRLTV
jgi:rhomboid protease GluP